MSKISYLIGKLFLSLMVCVFLTSCESKKQMQPQYIPLQAIKMSPNTVQIISPSIMPYSLGNGQQFDRLSIETHNSELLSSGMLQVRAVLINQQDYDIRLKIRTTFLDQMPSPTEPSTNWKDYFVGPNEVVNYNASSLRKGAVSYYVEVKEE